MVECFYSAPISWRPGESDIGYCVHTARGTHIRPTNFYYKNMHVYEYSIVYNRTGRNHINGRGQVY